MNKSHVAMGKMYCPISGELHGDGLVLLSTRIIGGELAKIFKEGTTYIAGFEIRPDLVAMEPTHLHLVELTEQPQKDVPPHEWKRTGHFASIRREDWRNLMSDPALSADGLPFVFVADGFIAAIVKSANENTEAEGDKDGRLA